MQQTNRIPKPIAILLIALLGFIGVMIGSVVVENANLGEHSWQFPAVEHTVNGYAGAPVGSPIYRPATEIGTN